MAKKKIASKEEPWDMGSHPYFEFGKPQKAVLASWRRRTGQLYLRHGYIWINQDINPNSPTYGQLGHVAKFSEYDSEKRSGKMIQVSVLEGTIINLQAWWHEPKAGKLYSKEMEKLKHLIVREFCNYEGTCIGRLQKELSAHETALIKMHIEEEVIISDDKN